MTVKKKYAVGDTVWIYGIRRDNSKSEQGTIIKVFTIDYGTYNNEPHYLIEVPTSIEPLLEVRTWHTISQTKDGHVGGIRDVVGNPDSVRKYFSTIGMVVSSEDDGPKFDGSTDIALEDENEPSQEEIHAAMMRSQKSSTLSAMSIIDNPPKSPKRKYYKKKN